KNCLTADDMWLAVKSLGVANSFGVSIFHGCAFMFGLKHQMMPGSSNRPKNILGAPSGHH
ncbi:MAG TPA: hypothetical protein DHV03_07740, partial [Alphaproteobacteria bacterium]|nr:hypothetical protein [Alphaproteobacteria bacterium]